MRLSSSAFAQCYPCLVFGDVRRTGCGCGLPRLKIRKIGPPNWRMRDTGPIPQHPMLTPDILTPTWCLKNRAERDAALDCLVWRIRKTGPSNWRMRVTGPISPHSGLTSDSLIPTCCLETCAERDAAPDCLALRIRKILALKPASASSGPPI